MTTYAQYLDPAISLEDRLQMAFEDLHLEAEQRDGITAFMGPLRVKEKSTYGHCIRVGLQARRIAEYMLLDHRALLYAGLLHDVGKAQTPLSTLTKTEGWTPADTATIRAHVMDGYRLLRDHFDFSADIMVWHHQFQAAGYPRHIPPPLHGYSTGTRVTIAFYGRLLALADCYDALHRINDKHGDKHVPTGEEIKGRMLSMNPDQRVLVTKLYEADVFTTHLF